VARGPDTKVSDVRILEEFVATVEPAFIAKEISDKFDITEPTARNRLESLYEKGYLHRKKPSSRTTIYWISEKGVAFYSEQRS